ncbi:MAG: TetR/AcrR family transcriptional regulator [Acidobacteriota bacterium]
MDAKQRLLDATRALLWEQGYESTSPRAIQARAGAGQGSFYHHFTGKLDLASQALDQTCDAMLASVDALVDAIADGDDPLRALARYLSQPRDALRGCRLGRHAAETAIDLPEIARPVARYFDGLTDALGRCVARLAADGRLAPDVDRTALVDALVASVQGGYVLARVHRDPSRLDAALRGTQTMLRALVRPSGDGSTGDDPTDSANASTDPSTPHEDS